MIDRSKLRMVSISPIPPFVGAETLTVSLIIAAKGINNRITIITDSIVAVVFFIVKITIVATTIAITAVIVASTAVIITLRSSTATIIKGIIFKSENP